MIQFAWPMVFILLPLPWLVQRLVPPAQESNAALKVPFYEQWASLQGNINLTKTQKNLPIIMAYCLWCLLVIAGARPEWMGDPVELPVSGRDLMMAVDLSGSMDRPDFSIEGKQVNRLTVVKVVAGDFIKRRKGDRIGLILFGKRAYVQTPLTHDTFTVRVMLHESEIGMAGKETAIGDAIGLAVKRLKDRPQQSRVLVLLTDGANTAGEVEPIQAAKLAAEHGLKIYTIGVGADKMRIDTFLGSRLVNPSAELDEKTLQAMADLTGGLYFRAKDTQGLQAVYQKLDELEPTTTESDIFRPVKSLYYYAIIAALLVGLYLCWLRGYVTLSMMMPKLNAMRQRFIMAKPP